MINRKGMYVTFSKEILYLEQSGLENKQWSGLESDQDFCDASKKNSYNYMNRSEVH